MALPVSKGGRRYGFKPSLVDPSIPKFKVSLPIPIPPQVDLTYNLGPVKDQGQLGACTAFAATGYMEYLYRRFKNQTPVFSPLFLYYKEREVDGDLGQGDTGSSGGSAYKVIRDTGICLESTDPYKTEDFETAPTQAQLTEAKTYSGGSMHTVVSVDDIKHAVASQYPVLVGITIYESFETGSWGSDWVMPPLSGSLLGGHEIYIKAYDDSRGAFGLRNSWGTSWGLKGDFWMPYDLLDKVLNEGRIMHFGKPW